MKKKDWISRIDAVTAAFQRELGPLAPENLNLKPNSQSWCIAQVLQHLILVNSSYFPVIVALKEKNMPSSAFERMLTHEERHLAKARDILEQLKNRA